MSLGHSSSIENDSRLRTLRMRNLRFGVGGISFDE